MQKQYLSDVLANILNDHLISSNGLHGEQAPFVDPAASKTKLFLAELCLEKQTVLITSMVRFIRLIKSSYRYH